MALWQFDIAFTLRGAPAPVVSADCYEIAPLSELLVTRARQHLKQRFGEPWQMLPRWLVFGAEDGTRFDVHTNEDRSGSVRARIDARSEAGHLLLAVCELADLLECELYVPEANAIVPPNKPELERVFRESSAVRFVRDPQGFFSERSRAR